MDRQGADDRMLRDQPIARRSLLKGMGADVRAGAGYIPNLLLAHFAERKFRTGELILG